MTVQLVFASSGKHLDSIKCASLFKGEVWKQKVNQSRQLRRHMQVGLKNVPVQSKSHSVTSLYLIPPHFEYSFATPS